MKKQFAGAVALMMACSGIAFAEDLDVKVTNFVKESLPNVPGREVTLRTLDFPPGSSTSLETHPGDEIGAVLEGTIMVGHGDETMSELKSGSTFQTSPDKPIRMSNVSKSPAKVVTVWILDGRQPATKVLPPGK